MGIHRGGRCYIRFGRCLLNTTVTYSSFLSKNSRIGSSYRGKIYIKKEAKAAEAALHRELTSAVKAARIKFYDNRIYLDIFVYKARSNTDSINFIDVIADVLKDVIKVDDAWYGIKSCDWALDRNNPRIIIKLFQPERKHGDKSAS